MILGCRAAGHAVSELSKSVPQLLIYNSTVSKLTPKPPVQQPKGRALGWVPGFPLQQAPNSLPPGSLLSAWLLGKVYAPRIETLAASMSTLSRL